MKGVLTTAAVGFAGTTFAAPPETYALIAGGLLVVAVAVHFLGRR